MSETTVPLLQKPEINHQWRPRALRKPILISFVGLCIGLFTANELVTFGCGRSDSCYVFGYSPNGNLPTLSTFVYTTIPTILGIILSLRWYVVHHDIIRLEPYYQMSTKYGAKASTSLFLQYSYDAIFLLPFKAFKKGHYIVALSSLILLIMNYALVPLVGTMFDYTITSSSIPGNGTRVEFHPNTQRLSAIFTFAAYDYARGHRDGMLLPFMTEDYALLPIKPVDGFSGFLPGENWTVLTTLVEADFDCAEAHHIDFNYSYWPDNAHLVIEIFQNESSNSSIRVCDALMQEKEDEIGRIFDIDCRDLVAFITPWTSLYADGDGTQFMLGWASGSSGYSDATANVRSPAPLNITAIFCTPKYYTQTVSATVSMPSGVVDLNGVHRIGEREEIKPLNGFTEIVRGYRNYEENIPLDGVFVEQQDRGVFPSPIPIRFGYPPNDIINVGSELVERFGNADRPAKPKRFPDASQSNVYMLYTNTLAAFALTDKVDNTAMLEKLLDARELESSIKRALKLWFAFAVVTETARSNETSTPIMVERKVLKPRITVNRYWSRGARIGLPLVASLAVLLVFLSEQRSCHLDAEPNTIAASLKLLSVSPVLCAAMQHAEYYPLATLMRELDKNEFYFRMGRDKGGSPQISVFRGDGENAVEVLETSDDLKIFGVPASNSQVQKDIELVSPDLIATLSLVLFPVLIVALIATNEVSKKQNGFPVAGDPNSFRSKLLYGYFPVAFGMMAEALLILLGSTQSMMGPYKALITKKAKFDESINVDYDRIPPHFQVIHSFQSFRLGDYTLVLLSLAILLSNVLAVLMSGMLLPSHYLPNIPKPHVASHEFTIARQEVFYRLNKKLTGGYSPSWTTDEYYIDSPFWIVPFDGDATKTYETAGFGVNVSCTVVPEDRVTFPCVKSADLKNTSAPPECESEAYRYHDNLMFLESPCGGTDQPMITYWNGTFTDYIQYDTKCPDRIFPLWAQNQRYTVPGPDRKIYWPFYNISTFEFGSEDQYGFVVLDCLVTDSIANLRATVHNGKVISVSDVFLKPLAKNITHSLAPSFIKVLKDFVAQRSVYVIGPLNVINWLMAQVNKATVLGNDTHIPSVSVVAETFAEVLKLLFPLLARLYAEEIFGVTFERNFEGFRVYLVSVNFQVALGVLVFCFCVVVVVYTKHAGKMMGHLPWSLAGLYSHLYASNAKNDIYSSGKAFDEVGVYAYGEYPSDLGKHYGVYKIGGKAVDAYAVEG